MPLLGFRVGFRQPAIIGILISIGIITVLFFKTGLSVNMPAGALYDFAPEGLRSILMKNF